MLWFDLPCPALPGKSPTDDAPQGRKEVWIEPPVGARIILYSKKNKKRGGGKSAP